jgi:hypothetical protein
LPEEPSAPIPKSPRRPYLWGRRDRGYKPQIQPLPEIGSSVARARQATFPNNFFDKSTEHGGLSLFFSSLFYK